MIVDNDAVRKGSERLVIHSQYVCYELICMGVGARHKRFGFIWFRAIYRMMRENVTCISGHVLECVVL